MSPPPMPNPALVTAPEQAELLDLAADAIIVRDMEGIIRYWNHGAEVLYGWSKPEALGQPVAVLLRAKYPRAIGEIDAEVRRNGRWEGEIEHQRQDGRAVVISSRWVLRRDPSGVPRGILQCNTDISARRQIEQALRRSEAGFRTLLESAPDAMLIFDPAGRVSLANERAEQLFGWTRAELLERTAEEFLAPRLRDAFRRHRLAYAREPRLFRPAAVGLDLYALRRDGSEFPVEVSLKPVRRDQAWFIISSIRDISDRKRAEADLARLHALELAQTEHLATLGEIAAGLAHEIKNPLAGIAAALDVLAGELRGQPEVMAEVRRQVHRIRGIVEDLLHYARPSPPRMETGNINLPVTRAVHLAAHAAAPRGVQVVFTPASLPPLPHDPEQIERMVANLAFNAVEAAPNGGAVQVKTLRLSGAPETVAIQVRDNGPGIPAEARAKLFRPFFTTKGDQGNGLGLPLCRRIAELHGGRIEVESQVGQGSTFTVLLPYPPAAPA